MGFVGDQLLIISRGMVDTNSSKTVVTVSLPAGEACDTSEPVESLPELPACGSRCPLAPLVDNRLLSPGISIDIGLRVLALSAMGTETPPAPLLLLLLTGSLLCTGLATAFVLFWVSGKVKISFCELV